MEEKQENLLQNTMQEKAKYYGNRIWRDMSSLGKWLILAVVTGCIVGAASSLFSYVLKTVTNVREEHLWIFYLLPVSGLIIVFLYQKFGKDDGGPNQVFMTIRSKDDVPLKSAPLIFISTALTHLTGGSAGREGAVIQLGGSIGNQLGRMLPLDEEDRHVMVMCGMSAAFAALFGTPMAAAVFAMEVVSVGVMYYTALVPCIIASLIASGFAASMGINPEAFHVTSIPALTIESGIKMGIVALCCAGLSILFCMALNGISAFYAKYLKNVYVRVVVASVAIIVITKLLGTTDYMGAGTGLIAQAIEHGNVRTLKLTRVAQSARYRAAHSPACQLERRFAPRQRRNRAVVLYRSHFWLCPWTYPGTFPIHLCGKRNGSTVLWRDKLPADIHSDCIRAVWI